MKLMTLNTHSLAEPDYEKKLEVFAGVVERAPKFWSDHGLEWFYRLCKEPWRLGRMMKLPLFLIHVKREKRKK